MVRTVEQVVKEHLDWEEERRRMEDEAEYVEPTQENLDVLSTLLSDLERMSVAEVEEAANEAHLVQALLDLPVSDLRRMLEWRDLSSAQVALLDQQQAEIAELREEKEHLEVKLQESEAWNTGLRDHNEWLLYQLANMDKSRRLTRRQ
jgi:hypothetical protein